MCVRGYCYSEARADTRDDRASRRRGDRTGLCIDIVLFDDLVGQQECGIQDVVQIQSRLRSGFERRITGIVTKIPNRICSHQCGCGIRATVYQ